MVKIALGIPHTPWRPERAEALARLKRTLGIAVDLIGYEQSNQEPVAGYREFRDREANHLWSERMWKWGLETGCDFFLTLQDDALVPSFFWGALHAMLRALPKGAPLGLAAQHPIGPELAAAGERWYRTRNWIVGTGYGLWRGDLEDLLAWRARQPAERILRTNEDTLLNDWASETGRATWHPLPTIVQHDTRLETNYEGNESHEYRTSSFTWEHAADPDGGDVGRTISDPGFYLRSETRPVANASPKLVAWPAPRPVARAELPALAPAGESVSGTIALAISHTPWVPARAASCDRLLEQLALVPELRDGKEHAVVPRHESDGLRHLKVVTDRAPNDVWSERMWRWAAETSAEWCVFLQDDVEVAPTFWGALRALFETCPGQILGLEVAHPIAPALAAEGESRLCTTSDMLIGPGYAMPRAVLREFLEWRRTKLRDGWIGRLHEDTMIGVFAATTGRKIVHPIPTIIDHDLSLESTYGNDAHVNRRPHVTWKDAAQYGHAWQDEDLEAPGFWQGRMKRVPVRMSDGTKLGYQLATNMDPAVIVAGARVPHLGCYYGTESSGPTAITAARWVEGLTERELLRLRQDTGDREKRRLAYSIRARGDWTGKARILVCTPTRGGSHPIHTASMGALASLFEADIDNGLELLGSWRWSEDVVRVRSRFLRAARETDATHIHFRDNDIAASPEVVVGMLRAKRGFVAAPYPRRDAVDLEAIVRRVRAGDPRPVEAFAYHYAVDPLPSGELVFDASHCAEVASLPLGCSLLSRECFEEMLEHYDAIDRDEVDLEEVQRQLDREPARRVLERIIQTMGVELDQWRKGHRGLRFTDRFQGREYETFALFQLLARGPVGARPLMSEDASFCQRLRDMGGKIWMYLGPGSPADHAGEHVYRGRVEAFGLERRPRAAAIAKAAEREAAAHAKIGVVVDPPEPGEAAWHDTDPPSSGERAAEAFALDTPEDPLREPEEPAVP